MTAVRLIEHRITRQLLRRREAYALHSGNRSNYRRTWQWRGHPWADRVIAILAVTTGLLVVGSYFEELLWAVLAAATLCTLR